MQTNPQFHLRGAFSISEFCTWASIGRTMVYRLIKEQQLQTFKVGRRTLISTKEADRWLEELIKTSQVSPNAVVHEVTQARN